MASAHRPSPAALTEVAARGRALGFVALVRELERALEAEGALPVGLDGPPVEERVRFRHDPSLAFSTSDVTRARVVPARYDGDALAVPEHIEITTTFLGLTGVVSPLPGYFAEEVAQEDDASTARRDFLDLFHHRLLSLLYRGLARGDVHAEHRADASDAHSRRLLALAGVDAPSNEEDDALSRAETLALVPLVVTRRATRHAIETAVAIVFEALLEGARVSLTPLTGEEVPFHEAHRIALGKRNNALGVTTMIGTRVLDRASRATLTIGPIGEEAFAALGRGGRLERKLRQVLDFVTGDAVDVDVVLVLAERARRALRLDGTSRLGVDSFLHGGKGDTSVRVSDARAAAGR